MNIWLTLHGVLLIAAYLFGSIPTGYLVGKWVAGVDIRQEGSGSTGATNVLRSVGKLPALAVLIVDILKGLIAIVLVGILYERGLGVPGSSPELLSFAPWMKLAVGLMAIIGHSKPVWLQFHGGKSVATGLGVLFGLSWPVALGTLGIFSLVLAISRIVSMSSIAGALGVSALMIFTGQPLAYILFAITAGGYVIVRHWSNIERIMAGTEPRLGEKLSPSTDNP